MPVLDPALDHDAQRVRFDKPFLFVALLQAAGYYTLLSQSPQTREIYFAVTEAFGEMLGPRLLTLRDRDCTLDLIQAIALTLFCKPIRQPYDGQAVTFEHELTAKLNDVRRCVFAF